VHAPNLAAPNLAAPNLAAPNPAGPILLVGYTMRMLAELAVKAGYTVIALDYFGDSDLRAIAPSVSLLRDFAGAPYEPAALVEAARTLAAPAIAYGASFENHPALVAQLAQGRQLLGNFPGTLTQVRDPFQLARALQAGGFAFPHTRREPPATFEFGPDRHWLWKPLRSGGGHGVREIRFDDVAPPDQTGIWQEKLEGLVCSATFVADGERAVLLGLTEQLVGMDAFGASAFRWCGNVMPPRLLVADIVHMMREAAAIANHLTHRFALRGLNGIDFIWQAGHIWTIEINPRPTAAAELIDRAYDLRIFDMHVKACRGALVNFELAQAWQDAPAVGKAVLFAAERDVDAGDTTGWFARNIRDVPHPHEPISKRHPICTLLAEGVNADEVLHKLHAIAADIRMELRTPS